MNVDETRSIEIAHHHQQVPGSICDIRPDIVLGAVGEDN
jgi:hypothetical protein